MLFHTCLLTRHRENNLSVDYSLENTFQVEVLAAKWKLHGRHTFLSARRTLT